MMPQETVALCHWTTTKKLNDFIILLSCRQHIFSSGYLFIYLFITSFFLLFLHIALLLVVTSSANPWQLYVVVVIVWCFIQLCVHCVAIMRVRGQTSNTTRITFVLCFEKSKVSRILVFKLSGFVFQREQRKIIIAKFLLWFKSGSFEQKNKKKTKNFILFQR